MSESGGTHVQVRPGAAEDLPVMARQRQGGGMGDGADWEIVLQRGHLIGTLPSQLLRLPLEWERVLRMKRKAVQSLLVRRLPSSLFSFLREAWNRRSCRNVKERCIDNIDLCNYENLCQDLTSWTKKDQEIADLLLALTIATSNLPVTSVHNSFFKIYVNYFNHQVEQSYFYAYF